MAKRESKGEQTRRTIVSRALALVSDVGYEGLSIGALAAESKLSKSGLFAHFKSKEALQLGVIEEVIMPVHPARGAAGAGLTARRAPRAGLVQKKFGMDSG